MIQELRTLLLNTTEASQFLLVPKQFSPITLSKIESRIRNAFLGTSLSSMEYKCFVANKVCSAIYRDSEFEELLKNNFDTRNYIEEAGSSIIRPTFSADAVDPVTIYVDLSKVKQNKKSKSVSYKFYRKESLDKKNTIIASGGYNNTVQEFVLSDSELMNSSSWKELNDSGVKVKFSLSPDYIEQGILDGGEPENETSILYDSNGVTGNITSLVEGGSADFFEITQPYLGEISVSIPFSISFNSILDSLVSIDGLIDFVSLIGESYPEILQKFNDESRRDRKLFAILCAYGVSVKRKI